MPSLEQISPDYDDKRLMRKIIRNERALRFHKADWRAKWSVRLRRVADGLQADFNATSDPLVRSRLADTLCRIAESHRVVLGFPQPGGNTSKKRFIDIPDARPVEAEPVSPVS